VLGKWALAGAPRHSKAPSGWRHQPPKNWDSPANAWPLLRSCNEIRRKEPLQEAFLCQSPRRLLQCTQLLKTKLVLKFKLLKSASLD
jgi:hypothetical protein